MNRISLGGGGSLTPVALCLAELEPLKADTNSICLNDTAIGVQLQGEVVHLPSLMVYTS